MEKDRSHGESSWRDDSLHETKETGAKQERRRRKQTETERERERRGFFYRTEKTNGFFNQEEEEEEEAMEALKGIKYIGTENGSSQ